MHDTEMRSAMERRPGAAFRERKRRTFMFYIVCDVSRSMWDAEYLGAPVTPYEVITDALPDLIDALEDDEQVRDIGRLSLVTFADKAQTVVPLTPVRDVKAVPALPKGVETDYRVAFRFLNDLVRNDAAQMQREHDPYRPVVYFITDGDPQRNSQTQPPQEWMPERDRLGDPAFDLRPSVVALGLGGVNAETLRQVASQSPPGAACLADEDQPPGDLLRAMLRSIVNSVTNSSESGELDFETPSGMRRL